MNADRIHEARLEVAAEHTHVRTLVGELAREALQTGHKVRHRGLRARLIALRAAIERANDVEERELVPLLETADAWGAARVERIRERHARVLGVLRAFEADVAPERHGPCDVVARIDALVAALEVEIDEEEGAAAMAERRSEGDTVTDDQEDA